MAEIGWEKDSILPGQVPARRANRWKFMAAGVVLLAIVVYLLFSSTLLGARYYVTVEDLLSNPEMLGKSVRVSGAVIGDPVFDPATNELRFVVANIPNDNKAIRDQGGLALVLHNAVQNPDAVRLHVVAREKEIPDLLQNEAQAIMSGRLFKDGDDFVFHADSITLKCPTRYEESVPDQAQ